jgi:hypothetical protein
VSFCAFSEIALVASEAYADGSDDDEGVEDEDEDDDEEGYDDLENSELMLEQEQEDVNTTTNPLRCFVTARC